MSVSITHLITYPIKSCAGIEHQCIKANALGLAHDRQWMLVDEDGIFLSQRKYPLMALIQPSLTADGLTLSAPGMTPITMLNQDTELRVPVTVWKDALQANVCPPEVNQWLSSFLGVPVRMVHYGQHSFRQIDPDFAAKGQAVAFADGYPILVVHQATLDAVNQQLTEKVGIERFRPNIVVSSQLPAWDELQWHSLTSNNDQINLVKPCARCVMTGVDQYQGIQTGTTVLKTLKQKFSYQDKAVFGINAIAAPEASKSMELAVGQTLEIH